MSHHCGSFSARREKATKGWENGHGNGKVTQAFQRAQKLQIREGQVSFLKSSDTFSQLDYDCLIASGNLPARATCHPVVVLRYQPNATHAVVTTISAYSSGDFNNNRAPWKQHCHRSKEPNEFRAFVGSERPNQKRAHLALQGGKLMPKPKVSWVHARTAFVVPITTLGWYNKSDTTLQLTEGSLEDLRNHMMILNGPDTLGSCLEDRRLQYSLAGGAIRAACSLRQTTQSNVTGPAVPPAQQIPRRAPKQPRVAVTIHTRGPTQPRVAAAIPAQQKAAAKPQPGLPAGSAWSKPLRYDVTKDRRRFHEGPRQAQDRRHHSHKGLDTSQSRCHNPGTAEGRRKAGARASCRQRLVQIPGLGNQYTSNEGDFAHDTEGEVDADKDRCSVDQELEGPDAGSDSPGGRSIAQRLPISSQHDWRTAPVLAQRVNHKSPSLRVVTLNTPKMRSLPRRVTLEEKLYEQGRQTVLSKDPVEGSARKKSSQIEHRPRRRATSSRGFKQYRTLEQYYAGRDYTPN